jgi:gliding motility-associated-like protein
VLEISRRAAAPPREINLPLRRHRFSLRAKAPKKQRMIKRLLILCYICFSYLPAGAQVCGLAQDEYTIDLNTTTIIPFEISNVINDDLSDVAQGVCGVEISLRIGPPVMEFEIWLESPAGQRVQLIGPNVQTFLPGGPTLLNIKFVQNDDPAEPDPQYPARWDNTIPGGYFPLINPGYQGSYYPFAGQLADFNMGSANGTWQLIVESSTFFELTPNILYDMRITLCDEAGRDCCFAAAGELRQDDLTACRLSPELQLDLPPSYPLNEIQPDPAIYGYQYAVSREDTLLAIEETPDLSGYPAGTYEICGLSYERLDSGRIPAPDGMLTMDSLRRNLQGPDPLFCGDLGDNCVLVTILPTAGPVPVQAMICPGDTLFLGSDALTNPGSHLVNFQSVNGCDSLVEVDLVFFPTPVVDSIQTLCSGDSILIGPSVYKTSGLYADTLQTVNGCDSIIHLDLTVLPPLTTTTQDTICAGETYAVGDSLFSASGSYEVVILSETGCDSTINLTLTVLDIPVSILVPDTITCSRPEIILAPQSGSNLGLSYTWYDAGNNPLGNDSLLTVNQAGDYYLEANWMQCSARDTATVVENLSAPQADAGGPDTLNCGSRAQLLIGGPASSDGPAYRFAWATIDGHFAGPNDQRQVMVDSAGIYQLVVTDTRNGCTDTSSVEIAADQTPPVAEAGPNQLITCADPVATLDGNGSELDMEYTWTALSGSLQPTADLLRPQAMTEGIYELTVYNARNECSSTDRAAVFTDTDPPRVSIADPPAITCDRTEIRLNAQVIDGGADPVISWTAPTSNAIAADRNTLSPAVTQGGDYQLLITNTDNGCVDSARVSVLSDQTPPAITFAPVDTLHCPGQVVTLEFLTTLDTSDLSILWLDPQGGPLGTAVTQDVVSAGIYRLEVRNEDNGCRSSRSIEVIDDSAPPVVTYGDLAMPCDADTFQMIAFLDQDTSRFSIQWTGPAIISGAGGLSPLVGSPGEYILTLNYLDAPCSFTDTAILTRQPCGPCLEADPAPALTCREAELQLEVRYCDECIGCVIDWTTPDGQIRAGANTLTPTIGRAGTYTVSVTDSFNITAQLDIVVGENRNYPIAEAGADTTLNCRVSSVEIGGVANDTGAGFQTRWRGLSTGFTSLGNTPVLEVDRADTYILEIQDLASGCISRDTVSVATDTIPPAADAGQDLQLTCDQATLQLDGSGSGAGPDINYQWTSADGAIDAGANTLTPQVSTPGTYILEVFNENNGCSASDEMLVELDNAPPEVTLLPPGMLTCTDSLVLLTPSFADTSSFTYEWCALDADGNPFACTAGADYQARTAGTYRLEVIDRQNGCGATTTVEVTANRVLPQVDAGADTVLNCLNDQIQLNGSAVSSSAQVSFEWTSPDGQILAGADGPAPLIAASGRYVLLATDLNSRCSAADTVLVTADLSAPEARLAQDVSQLLLTCRDDTLLLDASPSLPGGSGGLDYLWTTEEVSGGIAGANNLATVSITSGGIYELTIQDRTSGCRDTLSFQVNVNTIQPGVSLSSSGGLTCLETEAILDGSASETGPGVVHRWFRDDQLLPDDNLTLTVTQGGTYRLESAYLDNGCTNEAAVEVSEDRAAPQISIAPPMILDCDNPAASLDASATIGQALRFSWSTLDGNIVSGEDTPVATVNAPGLYTLRVVNGANGCSAVSSTQVNLTGLRIGRIGLAITEPSCPGEADGAIRVLSVEGGTDPFVVALNDDNFTTNNDFTQLSPGEYRLTVMDAAGCEADTTVTLQAPLEVQVSLGPDQEIRKGEEVVLRVATNVKEPQSIRWSPESLVNGQDTLVQTLQPDRSATYRVELTDERGCTGTDEVQIRVSNEVPVYIANAFSPNEDGENDRFFIQADDAVTNIKSFRIFDRWGNAVFEATDIPPNDPKMGWDGYYQGYLMNAAVFVYFAELELAGGDVERVQGEVLLVR